jgi:hypothetical protein
MKHFKFIYDANPPGGGGLPPSLQDIENGIEPKPTDLNQAAQQQAAEEARLAAEAQAQAATAETAYNELVKEATNTDGSLKPGYVKNAEGKVEKDPNSTPADDPNADEDEGDFWEDVNKLHGVDYAVEYPEGVDPVSPEGAYHREKVIMKQAIDNFENYLKESDPRSYAYMLHRQAGGSDEDFFSQKTFSLPEYTTFKDNADVQVSVYKSSLIGKGIDAESAQVLVDKAIKDGKLFDYANAAYNDVKASHEKELKLIEEANQKEQQVYQTSVNKLNQSLTVAIQEGKGMNIMIPDTDKQNFLQFVRETVEYDSKSKKFLLVQPVEDSDLNRQLEALYLLYKKGDLKSLIQREAQTQNVKKLKRVIQKSGNGHNSGGGEPPAPTKKLALGDI